MWGYLLSMCQQVCKTILALFNVFYHVIIVNNLKDAIVAASNFEYDEAMPRQTLLTCLQALLLTCDGQPGVSPERLGPGEHVWVWRGAGQRRHARLGARPGRAEVVSGVVPADTTRSHCTLQILYRSKTEKDCQLIRQEDL